MVTKMHTPTTPLSPDRRGLPPPVTLDLIDADRKAGWVRGATVGFRGFADEHEAAHAAWVAYRELARRLAKATGGRMIPVAAERLTIARRGDAEVVLASGRRVATLLRPGVGRLRGDDSFGFELRLPAPTNEARVRAMAYAIYFGLRKSGVRWAMWARDRHAPRGGAAPDTAADTRPVAALAPTPTEARSGAPSAARWGAAILGLVGVLLLGLVVPRAAVFPVAVTVLAVGAVVGVLEVPRRWFARRGRAPGAMPAAGIPDPAGRGDGHRAEAPGWASVATVASVVALLIAFDVPARWALALIGLSFATLVALRLFATPRGGTANPAAPPRPRPTHDAPYDPASRAAPDAAGVS